MKFRSEIVFGDGYRDIINVMTYETYSMGNSDILITLSETISSYNPDLSKQMEQFAEEISENGYVEDMGEADWNDFFETVISNLNEIYNTDLKYCLWLADYDVVKNYYGNGKLSKDEIDAYEESNVILSDLGKDGTLYAYSENPEPIEYKLEEEREEEPEL